MARGFNEMASALATTENMRRSFVANVSHELKTPMTTIGGFIDGILDGTIPKERHEHYLRIVSDEVRRLSRLGTGHAVNFPAGSRGNPYETGGV